MCAFFSQNEQENESEFNTKLSLFFENFDTYDHWQLICHRKSSGYDQMYNFIIEFENIHL